MADPYKDKVVLYLPFEGSRHGDTVILDKTGKTVTCNENTILSTAVAPPFGTTSAYFDGTGDYLSVPASSAWDFGAGDFTIECWLRHSSLPDFIQAVVTCDNVNVTRGWLLVNYYNGSTKKLNFWAWESNSTQLANLQYETPLTINTWYHIAVVRKDSNWQLYVDGTLVHSVSASGTIQNANCALYVGSRMDNGSPSANSQLNGYIKDLRITKGVARYTGNFSVSQTTTVDDDYWASVVLAIHGEGTGTTFTDVSNSAKTITTNGNTTHSTAVAPPFGSSSIYFDGTGDYLTLPNSDDYSFGTGDFTIECWVNSQATSGTYIGVVANTGTGAAGQYHWRLGVRFNSTNNVSFTAQLSGGWLDIYPVSAVNVNDSQWHHLAVVRRSGTFTIFVDGIARVSTYSAEPVGTTGRGCYIGYNAADVTYYTGYIKDFRITKGVARYTQNFTPKYVQFPDKTAIKTIAKPIDWDSTEPPRIFI